MTEGVFPAIRKLYAGEDVVYVQLDGAPGHTGKKTPELLAEAGRKRKRGEPLIELVQQPAQSPDFNICDLHSSVRWQWPCASGVAQPCVALSASISPL